MSPSPTSKPATTRQLAYLKALAERTATSFAYPRSANEASREINRLRQLTPLDAKERTLDRRLLDSDRERHAYATAPRPHELAGHGSTATWR